MRPNDRRRATSATHNRNLMTRRTNATMAEQPDDNTGDNRVSGDILKALKLRFKFQNFEFQFLWNCLQDVGWTCRRTTLATTGYQYQAPGDNGLVFDDWRCVVEYMDQFALPEVCSTLQMTNAYEHFTTTQERCDGRELRQQALEEIFEQSQDEILRRTQQGNLAGATPGPHSTATTSDTFNSHSKRRDNKRGSVTQSDKGTELYLHGKKSKSKRKNNSKAKDSALTNLGVDMVLPSVAEVQGFLGGHASIHTTQGLDNVKEHSQWRFLLSTNHSLLFFGTGSKYKLLNDFCENDLVNEGYALQIDGFDKSVSIEGILDLLVAQFLGGNDPQPMARITRCDGTHNVTGEFNPWRAPTLVERAIVVSRACAFEATETLLPIFIVIHNLDGESLRSQLALDALAALVINSNVENSTRCIRLLASVDHASASELMFSTQNSANLSWIYQPVHTHQPYVKELDMLVLPSSKSKRNQQQTVRASRVEHIESVLDSLAPRHTEVMQVLARLQLESKDDDWVKMMAFRKQCKNEHLVTKDAQLDVYLNELNDHGLINTDNRKDSGEFIRAPFGADKLKQILTFQRS